MPKTTLGSTGLKNPTGGIGDTLSSSIRKMVTTHEKTPIAPRLHGSLLAISGREVSEISCGRCS